MWLPPAVVRAGFTVRARALHAIPAVVAVEGLAQFSEGVKEWEQEASTLCQNVFDVRRAAPVIPSLNKIIMLHVAQAADQRAATDRMESRQEFRRAFGVVREVAHHEHRPFVADQL